MERLVIYKAASKRASGYEIELIRQKLFSLENENAARAAIMLQIEDYLLSDRLKKIRALFEEIRANDLEMDGYLTLLIANGASCEPERIEIARDVHNGRERYYISVSGEPDRLIDKETLLERGLLPSQSDLTGEYRDKIPCRDPSLVERARELLGSEIAGLLFNPPKQEALPLLSFGSLTEGPQTAQEAPKPLAATLPLAEPSKMPVGSLEDRDRVFPWLPGADLISSLTEARYASEDNREIILSATSESAIIDALNHGFPPETDGLLRTQLARLREVVFVCRNFLSQPKGEEGEEARKNCLQALYRLRPSLESSALKGMIDDFCDQNDVG